MKINEFLKKIADDIKLHNREFDKDDFYYMLKYINIKKDTSLVDDIEKYYNNFLQTLDNSLIKYETRKVKSGELSTNYIGFYVDKKANYEEAVKLYFPVKYEYLISALKTIFSYLIRNNIESIVKFHEKATNENIVIRFYHREDVLPFINYCYTSFSLTELLEDINPFIANIHGLGIVEDDNTVNSFLGTLSEMLAKFFQEKKEKNELNRINDLDFLKFIVEEFAIESDEIKKFNLNAIIKSINAIINEEDPII